MGHVVSVPNLIYTYAHMYVYLNFCLWVRSSPKMCAVKFNVPSCRKLVFAYQGQKRWFAPLSRRIPKKCIHLISNVHRYRYLCYYLIWLRQLNHKQNCLFVSSSFLLRWFMLNWTHALINVLQKSKEGD